MLCKCATISESIEGSSVMLLTRSPVFHLPIAAMLLFQKAMSWHWWAVNG